MSYYAVKLGRQPGIYGTWKECQEQVIGFSGAVFKKFSTQKEANEFIELASTIQPTVAQEAQRVAPKSSDDSVFNIYTDGSDCRGRLGYGIFCQYKNKNYGLMQQITPSYLRTFGIAPTTKVSNPTAEFLAVCRTLEVISELPSLPTDVRSVCIYSDYVGSAHWIQGNWQAKEIYIQKIKQRCLELLRKLNVPVVFHHVKGHSGDYGNEQADRLAGGQWDDSLTDLRSIV